MKMRIVALMLMMVYVLTLSVNINATVALSTASTSNEAYVISVDDFSKVFSGPYSKETVSKLTAERGLQTTNISVSNILLNREMLSCTINLTVGGKLVKLPISGKLASGVRNQLGMNSIVVEVPGKVSGYTVRLFEIVNDSKEDTWLLYDSLDASNSVSGKPHMRIYLEDQNGVLYLMESALPTVLQKLSSNSYPQADKYKDAIFWATDIVEHTFEKIPVTDELIAEFGLSTNARNLEDYLYWMPESAYYDTFYVGNTKNVCSSLPYVKYLHKDLDSSADTTWIVAFNVAEHNSVGGTTLYGYNSIYYTNLDISIACGDYTTMLETSHEGRMYEYDSTTEIFGNAAEITIGFLKSTWPSLPIGSTYVSLLGLLDNMTNLPLAYHTITLGSSSADLFSNKVCAVRENLGVKRISECTDRQGANNVVIHDVGDYYTIHLDVTRIGSPESTTTTMGMLMFSFDVWSGTTKRNTLYATIPLGYTVYAPGGG